MQFKTTPLTKLAHLKYRPEYDQFHEPAWDYPTTMPSIHCFTYIQQSLKFLGRSSGDAYRHPTLKQGGLTMDFNFRYLWTKIDAWNDPQITVSALK